jgi:hypothetical protein
MTPTEFTEIFCKEFYVKNTDLIKKYILDKYSDILFDYRQKNYQHPIRLTLEDRSVIRNLLEELSDLEFFNVLIFRLEPKTSQGIHVDPPAIQHKLYTALNIPIANCDQGEMVWYKGKFIWKEILLENGVNYNIIDSEESKIVPIYKKIISTPHIVRNDIPHNIINSLNVPRVMLSLRFKKNLDLPVLPNDL